MARYRSISRVAALVRLAVALFAGSSRSSFSSMASVIQVLRDTMPGLPRQAASILASVSLSSRIVVAEASKCLLGGAISVSAPCRGPSGEQIPSAVADAPPIAHCKLGTACQRRIRSP